MPTRRRKVPAQLDVLAYGYAANARAASAGRNGQVSPFGVVHRAELGEWLDQGAGAAPGVVRGAHLDQLQVQ